MYMTKSDFKEWAIRLADECTASNRFSGYLFGGNNELTSNNTIVIDHFSGKTGVARLHPNDDFDFRVGLAIAYARCREYEIPKLTIRKKLSEMKYGDRFLGTFGNKIYTFIGKSTLRDRYILENTAENYTCYWFYDNEEYEMVE